VQKKNPSIPFPVVTASLRCQKTEAKNSRNAHPSLQNCIGCRTGEPRNRKAMDRKDVADSFCRSIRHQEALTRLCFGKALNNTRTEDEGKPA